MSDGECETETEERQKVTIFMICPANVSSDNDVDPITEASLKFQEFFEDYGCAVTSSINVTVGGDSSGGAGDGQLAIIESRLEQSDLVFLICTPSLFKALIDGQHTGVVAKLLMHSSFLSDPSKAGEKFICVFLDAPGCPIPSASMVPPILGAYKRYTVKLPNGCAPDISKVKVDLHAGGSRTRKKLNLLKSPFLQLVNRVNLKQEECEKKWRDEEAKKKRQTPDVSPSNGRVGPKSGYSNGAGSSGSSQPAGGYFSIPKDDSPVIVSPVIVTRSYSKGDSVERDTVKYPTSSTETVDRDSLGHRIPPSTAGELTRSDYHEAPHRMVAAHCRDSQQPPWLPHYPQSHSGEGYCSPPPPAPPPPPHLILPPHSYPPRRPPPSSVPPSAAAPAPPQLQLDQVADDSLLWAVSSEINYIKRVARTLRLKEADITAIQMNDPNDYVEQKYQMLLQWARQTGAGATARVLIQALRKEGELKAANQAEQHIMGNNARFHT